MNSFTTRVELHGATSTDYEALHREMERRGFSRTITADDGIVYKLPEAEYDFHGSQTGEQVRTRAQEAAKAAAPLRRHSVLVTEAKARYWSGLDQANRRAA